ncbi:hypothetical protein HispidOSU_027907, partial [Sigmodon hispidus]
VLISKVCKMDCRVHILYLSMSITPSAPTPHPPPSPSAKGHKSEISFAPPCSGDPSLASPGQSPRDNPANE